MLILIVICCSTLAVSGKNNADNILKNELKPFKTKYLISSELQIKQYISFGCLNIAKKKAKTLASELDKMTKEKFAKILKRRNIPQSMKENILERLIQYVRVRKCRLEAKIQQKREDIRVWESHASTILKTTAKYTGDKNEAIKDGCQLASLKQDKSSSSQTSVCFYLSSNFKDNSNKIILAYVIKNLLLKNKIKANISFAFDAKKSDTIILTSGKKSKKIKWNKSLSYLNMLEKVMVNFIPQKTEKPPQREA
jgi:hypothetical protein